MHLYRSTAAGDKRRQGRDNPRSVHSVKKHYFAMPYIFREDAALRLEKAYEMITVSLTAY